jgi:hypothetical protein
MMGVHKVRRKSEIRNPKSETNPNQTKETNSKQERKSENRNPKSETNPNKAREANSKRKASPFWSLLFPPFGFVSDFDFRISDLFRISDFGFRIYTGVHRSSLDQRLSQCSLALAVEVAHRPHGPLAFSQLTRRAMIRCYVERARDQVPKTWSPWSGLRRWSVPEEATGKIRTPRIGQIQSDGQFKNVWTAPEPVRPEAYPSTRSAEAWRAFLHDLYTGWGDRWSAPEDAKAKATGQ